MNKVYYSEDQINQMIDELIEKIQSSGECFTQVIGIKNGGIPISTRIAQILNVAHTPVRISHYVGDTKRQSPVVHTADIPNGHVLVVDDLVDTGATMSTFYHYFGNHGMIAVLFWNTRAQPKPDFYVQEKPDAWIVFPWEKE